MKRPLLALAAFMAAHSSAQTPASESISWPSPTPSDFVIPNFKFDSGEELAELKLHYETIGELKVYDDGSTNAVFLMHGSDHDNTQFLVDEFAGVLFNLGQLLSADEYFLILRDAIGHGESSSPRNTGLRANFPRYQYSDIIRADHQLLTEHLGINHTRLVLGVSMGGMHTWLWGEEYPDFMDALMPLSCLPIQITGHNRFFRKLMIELIQLDPAWKGGDYETQPLGALFGAMSVLGTMAEGSAYLQRTYSTRDAVDAYADGLVDAILENLDTVYDVNNLLYAYNASYTYNPGPKLGSIKAPLTSVNTADDLMNPAELGILEHAVRYEMQEGLGRALVIPTSNETYGHGSYISADLWKTELLQLLQRSRR